MSQIGSLSRAIAARHDDHAQRERLLKALWPFGQPATLLHQAHAQQRTALTQLATWLIDHPQQRTCIIGPSGAGKSTLLAALAKQLGPRSVRVDRLKIPRQRVGMLGSQSIEAWLAVLAKVGLAEAAILATNARSLSLGQQRRLQLALAVDHARSAEDGQPMTLLIDEVTSGLDRITRLGLVRTLVRLTIPVQGPVIRLIAAGCDEQLPASLQVDRSVMIQPDARVIQVTDHTLAGAPRKEGV